MSITGEMITGRKLCGCYIRNGQYFIVCKTHSKAGIKEGDRFER